ncbi:MAG: hypothetical protein DSY42_07365 [Aquifex sp.]|nr:MAG: hypothetical protein DSY42_07365 [Aquifex sp.]
MLAEAIKEILAEVRMEKVAEEQQEFSAPENNLPTEPQEGLSKISSEDAEHIKAKLSKLGLDKYAAYVDEINDVAGEFVKALLEEMEKIAAKYSDSFGIADKVDLSNVDPITKFALS